MEQSSNSQYFRCFTPRKEGNITVIYDDNNVAIFSFDHTLFPDLDVNGAGVTKCLQARINGGWKGDILHPEPYDFK